ncbi:zinc finger protein 14-like [Physella acuta]|uniref:zinc finger protein 14-like n=1 Tax=Physella acuta TaxID=109671 RepID=UPI0027DC6F62|nr:zinc finger protein 14-like [Physella acuta]
MPHGHQTMSYPTLDQEAIKRETLECPSCLRTFIEPNLFSDHVISCAAAGNYTSVQCRVCPLMLESTEELTHHMRAVHHYFPCSQCTIWCPTMAALHGHIHREHKPKFVCSICTKTFHCKINYKGHMNMHLGKKPYVCAKCGKTFAYQQSQYAHQKMCN